MNIQRSKRNLPTLLLYAVTMAAMMGMLGGCAKKHVRVIPPKPPAAACDCPKMAELPVQMPLPEMAEPSKTPGKEPKAPEVKIPDYGLLKAASWEAMEGFEQDQSHQSWPAWMQSCGTLVNKPVWQTACNAASVIHKQYNGTPPNEVVKTYYRQYFKVYQATNLDGTDTGMITGYYEPVLKGSRTQSSQFPYPLYQKPDDLITVELDTLYPDLKYKRVRGRLVGNKLVPYYNRAEIETTPSPLRGREFMYIDDIIDVFFLQIQGSGLVQLDTGEQVHIGYADQNGHTYNSIGRLLVERGEISLDKASMQGIKNWARNNLPKLRELLNQNPSYVFFRELPANLPGPLGALGVPILAEKSIAVDPKYIPIGAPVFLSTTEPNSTKPLRKLVMAQDTGGAIKGGVRVDFFWGAGNEAGARAGAMKQTGKIWVLLPKEFVLK
jgi:membrane-bound lytic murein transglycosylase A